VTPDLLARLQAARAEGRPVAVATDLASGRQALLPSDDPRDDAPEPVRAAAARALRQDRTDTLEHDGATWFLHPHNPAMRLVVVGAVHVAQALVPMAAQLGYAVLVADPRRAFANDERFPGVTISTDWPDEALDAARPDSRTAIVTLTHDPKLDDPALDRALRSDAFYVGALGSRRTHAARLDRLRALGHDDAALARIRGPVGLDIGAVTAGEIALSIMAQLVAVRRGAPDGANAAAPGARAG
jgi:xanthine dehydrogenase accessory factor